MPSVGFQGYFCLDVATERECRTFSTASTLFTFYYMCGYIYFYKTPTKLFTLTYSLLYKGVLHRQLRRILQFGNTALGLFTTQLGSFASIFIWLSVWTRTAARFPVHFARGFQSKQAFCWAPLSFSARVYINLSSL